MIRKSTILLLPVVLFTLSAHAQVAPVAQWIFDRDHIKNDSVNADKAAFRGHITGKYHMAGEPGEAIVFDGATSINVPGVTADDLPQKLISVEAWVKIKSPLTYGGILGYFQDNGSYEKGWILGYNSTHFSFAVSTAGKLTYMPCTTPYEKDRWYHVVGTYDGQTMKIYINGQFENSSTDQNGPIDYPPKAFLEIGSYRDDNEFFRMSGQLSKVVLYDKVLPEDQIKKNYQVRKVNYPQVIKLKLGPYAQFASPDSVNVFWQTETKTPSVLKYGQGDELKDQIVESEPKKFHQVTLTDLAKDTVYKYQIFTKTGSKQNSTRVFEMPTNFHYRKPAFPEIPSPYSGSITASRYAQAAKYIVEKTGIARGYCLVLGCAEGQLAYELAKLTDLSIIVCDSDQEAIHKAVNNLKKAKIYGIRVTARQVESMEKLPFTSYFANLIVSDSLMDTGQCSGTASELYRVLCPGGGVALLGQTPGMSKKIDKSKLNSWLKQTGQDFKLTDDREGTWAMLVRSESLAGAGRWSHQYADPDNSAQSNESLSGVTATTGLQVQWLGRPGADAGIDRNPRMPAPLSINGRLFHQGLNRMIAMDAYNGAILWQLEIPDLRRVNLPRDASNWCADDDYLYVAVKDKCWKLEAGSGQLVTSYDLIDQSEDFDYDWGYVASVSDKIYGSSTKEGSIYSNFWGGGSAGWYDAQSGPVTFKVCSDNLFVCDKKTGKKLWIYEKGVIVNTTITIGANRIYFVESRNASVKKQPTGRLGSAEMWQDQFIVALNAETGKLLWETPVDTPDGIVYYGQYAANKYILTTSLKGIYYLFGYDAEKGERLWEASHKWVSGDHSGHIQHPAIVNNAIYVEPCGYDLGTGKEITNKMGDRSGCATRAAMIDALVYRGSARQIAMWNVNSGKTTVWTKLRPSCWLSCIPANGLILSPEGGGGCSCGGWLQTSIAFKPVSSE